MVFKKRQLSFFLQTLPHNMIKRYCFTVGLIICCLSSIEATDYINSRLKYSINLGLTNGFVNSRSGITDHSVIIVNRPSIGASFGGGIRYQLNRSLSLYSGINLMSLESVSYNHYGTHSTTLAGYPQLPLYFAYKFKESPCKRAYFLSVGTVLSLSVHDGFFISQRDASLYFPERRDAVYIKSGLFPLLHLGFGWTTTTKKGREIEYSFHFHRGFHKINRHIIETFNPYRRSTFSYNGTILKFQINWYFGREK